MGLVMGCRLICEFLCLFLFCGVARGGGVKKGRLPSSLTLFLLLLFSLIDTIIVILSLLFLGFSLVLLCVL